MKDDSDKSTHLHMASTNDSEVLKIVANPSGGLQTLLTKIAARIPRQGMLVMYCSPDRLVLHAIIQQSWVYHAVIDPSSFKQYEAQGTSVPLTLPSNDDTEEKSELYLKLVIPAEELQSNLKLVKTSDELEFSLSGNTLLMIRRNSRIRAKKYSMALMDTALCPPLEQWSLASDGFVKFNVRDFRTDFDPDIKAKQCCFVTFVANENKLQMLRYKESDELIGDWDDIPRVLAQVSIPADKIRTHTIRLKRDTMVTTVGIMLDITDTFHMLLPVRDGGAIKLQGKCAGLDGQMTVMFGQHEA